MNLIDEITKAFIGIDRPEGDLFIKRSWDEGEEKYFKNSTWNQEHSVDDLKYHNVAMGLFSPEAHNYFLPAFMIASIQDEVAADIIPDNILYHFSDHQSSFWNDRIKLLTKDQKKVVSKFLITIFGNDDFEKEHLEKALSGLK